MEVINNFKHIHIDPTHHFRDQDITPKRVFDALGLIPQFFLDSKLTGVSIALQEAYQFFGGWRENDGAKVEGDVYKYPQDPELHPLAKYWIEGEDEYALQYQYGIICICDKDGKLIKWSRFD